MLLGALHTRFVWIQGIFNQAFEDMEPVEALEKFSTPKLVTVLDILRRFELTTPHESKVQRDEEEEDDSENEITVADYLEQQKQAEAQEAASRGGRFFGRRKHYRSKAEALNEKQRRKQHFLDKQVKFQENTSAAEDGAKEKSSLDDPTALAEAKVVNESVQESLVALIDEEELKPIATDKILESAQIPTLKETKVETLKESPKTSCANYTKNIDVEEVEDSNSNQKKDEVRPIIKYQRRNKFANKVNEDALCGLLLCEDRFVARLLYVTIFLS